MRLEGPSKEEVEKAVDYLRQLRRDPEEFERWVDRVVEGWLKRKNYRLRSVTSKGH